MFYDSTAIDYLIDRVGWADAIPPTDLTIDVRNTKSDSGRYFDEFNKMVTVENVSFTISNDEVNQFDYNDYLYRMKKDAVLSALSYIFDNNERAYYKMCNSTRVDISDMDYSGVIQTKGGLFDNVIGLAMACKAIELFITTHRRNDVERDNKFNYNTLQTELNGMVNDFGKITTKGLYALRSLAIGKVIDILFPTYSRPTLTARRVM